MVNKMQQLLESGLSDIYLMSSQFIPTRLWSFHSRSQFGVLRCPVRHGQWV